MHPLWKKSEQERWQSGRIWSSHDWRDWGSQKPEVLYKTGEMAEWSNLVSSRMTRLRITKPKFFKNWRDGRVVELRSRHEWRDWGSQNRKFFTKLERWQSGRMRRSWKPLRVTPPGVRIPLSPQFQLIFSEIHCLQPNLQPSAVKFGCFFCWWFIDFQIVSYYKNRKFKLLFVQCLWNCFIIFCEQEIFFMKGFKSEIGENLILINIICFCENRHMFQKVTFRFATWQRWRFSPASNNSIYWKSG